MSHRNVAPASFAGEGRERPAFREDSFPTVAREIVRGPSLTTRAPFPFESWALANRFEYPRPALGFLCCCESAAEAYLAREVTRLPSVCCVDITTESDHNVAIFEDDPELSVQLQVRTSAGRIDMVVYERALRFKLAVEIDGMGFHHRAAEQVAADYIRERRIVALGFVVIRFTAQEVFAAPAECWRQIDAIVKQRRAR